ncbi:restriction endonuclease [Clostridium perfringens]|uniref:restriction endonuclease n=1 Tax=Clostridium perfringens TaxID=1502 RepID=UPI000D710987|nr:restriction endonuclease [Clostridium perfringens]PWX62876.1 restriction endonuclease [Clostridium perfringens]
MKITKIVTLIENGSFASSSEYSKIEKDVLNAITSMENPIGSGSFTLNSGKKANGVKPIKDNFINYLNEHGWEDERKITDSDMKKRRIDTTYKIENTDKYFGVEWETGNISSSHRAINRLLLGMIEGKLLGGILVLPSRNMYYYLTDRVGNFQEIEPYFKVWKLLSSKISNGVLKVIEIEHDKISDTIQAFKKGTDGRSLK